MKSPRTSVSPSSKTSPSKQLDRSPKQSSDAKSQAEAGSGGSRVLASPRSQREVLKAVVSSEQKDFNKQKRLINVDRKFDQASQAAPITDRKQVANQRDLRSGGNLSRNIMYSELGQVDGHLSDENATLEVEETNQKVQNDKKLPKNPFVKQNGVLSEHDFVMNSKARQKIKPNKNNNILS